MRAQALAFVFVGLAPAIARADDAIDTTARVHFATSADADAIQHAACSAETHIRIDGASVPLVVRVERPEAAVACTPSAGATRAVVVHIAALEGNRRDVALTMDLGTSISLQDADVILDALAETGGDLARRVANVPRTTRPLSPTLTALGIALGVTGLAAVVASYIWELALIVQPASCSEPLSVSVPIFGSCITASQYLQTEVLEIAGVATMGLGATLALLGQLRVSVKTSAKKNAARITPLVAPTRGGMSAGFVVTF